MLLNQAIATQQNLYAEIQLQIEALQEKQREINAYLQRLGGVESQMESAAQLVQEAIASIHEVCPDELGAYRDLILGLFGSAPTGFIAAADVTIPSTDNNDPSLDVAPTPATEPTTGSSDEWGDEPSVEVVASIVVEPETSDDVEKIMTAMSTISWQEFKQLAAKRGIKVLKRSKSEISDDFRKLLKTADAQTLAAIRGAVASVVQKKLLTPKAA